MKNKNSSADEPLLVSYSQNGEDVLLWRALQLIPDGFYIDVGANDPVEHSVTKGFYDLGWSGINIEPGEGHFLKLIETRPRDITLQVTVGESEGTDEFFEFEGTGLSTTDGAIAATHQDKGWGYRSRKVTRKTLKVICEEFVDREIHFLKIDVEGAEESVLRGADFERYRPWVVVVEATEPLSEQRSNRRLDPLLITAGYQPVFFDGINCFYVANEHSELASHFDRPVNALDRYTPHWVVEQYRLKGQCELLERRNQDLRNRIQSLHSSLSWRLSSPLRVLDRLRNGVIQIGNSAWWKLNAPFRKKRQQLALQALRLERAKQPLLGFLEKEIARELSYSYPENLPGGTGDRLTSGLCTRQQLETSAFRYWLKALKLPFKVHRKQWEFAYILQALYERGCLKPGSRGLGFAVGEESMPALMASLGCLVVATDLDPSDHRAQAWAETAQLASSLEKLRRPDICSDDVFSKSVSYRHVDMNHIPAELADFDFTWSSCSFEHCGSIELGLKFVENQMACLKPGGVAVHTTEFNLTSNEETLAEGMTVIFRKQDIDSLVERLTVQGHRVEPICYAVGTTADDQHVDILPFTDLPHLKLLLGDQYISTSIGLIIHKGG